MTGAIVAGGVADLASIMPVMTTAFPARYGEAWTASQCIGVMAMPGSRLLIARNAIVRGFALTRLVLDEAELMLLAVAPAVQRRGTGRQLLQAALDDARRSGAKTIHLEVRADNAAIALYSEAGFEKVGVRARYYRGIDGVQHDAATYRMALT